MLKEFLDNDEHWADIQRFPEVAQEYKTILSAIGINVGHIIAANIKYPMWRLLALGFNRAEIESALKKKPDYLKSKYHDELIDLIDYFCNKEKAGYDFLTPRTNIPDAVYFNRQILIKAIKNGYKDVVVKRIRTGIIKRNGDPSERNISGRRQKILITQIARIQPTNPSLEPPK